jgi:hypothetical protein
MYLEVLDFLMAYESYLRKRRISISSRRLENIVLRYVSVVSLSRLFEFESSRHFQFSFTDISKVTAHERIQHLYLLCLAKITSGCGQENYIFLVY